MDEEVKYLKSKFYFLNSQISPEPPAQALHGPDQTPPAPFPVELGMGGLGWLQLPLALKEKPRWAQIPLGCARGPWGTAFQFFSQWFPSWFSEAEGDPWISLSLISQTLTDQCPVLFAILQGLCFAPGTFSLFSRPGIIFQGGKPWELGTLGSLCCCAITELRTREEQIFQPLPHGMFLMYSYTLLLFFPSLKFAYFCSSLGGFCEDILHDTNEDIKMTNPAGCAQGWGSGGCSRGFLPHAQHKNDGITS